MSDAEIPPPRVDPRRWELDQGSLGDWLRAIARCQRQCYRLRECQQQLDGLPIADRPQAVVQAGIAFGTTRVPLTVSALRRRDARPDGDRGVPIGAADGDVIYPSRKCPGRSHCAKPHERSTGDTPPRNPNSE